VGNSEARAEHKDDLHTEPNETLQEHIRRMFATAESEAAGKLLDFLTTSGGRVDEVNWEPLQVLISDMDKSMPPRGTERADKITHRELLMIMASAPTLGASNVKIGKDDLRTIAFGQQHILQTRMRHPEERILEATDPRTYQFPSSDNKSFNSPLWVAVLDRMCRDDALQLANSTWSILSSLAAACEVDPRELKPDAHVEACKRAVATYEHEPYPKSVTREPEWSEHLIRHWIAGAARSSLGQAAMANSGGDPKRRLDDLLRVFMQDEDARKAAMIGDAPFKLPLRDNALSVALKAIGDQKTTDVVLPIPDVRPDKLRAPLMCAALGTRGTDEEIQQVLTPATIETMIGRDVDMRMAQLKTASVEHARSAAGGRDKFTVYGNDVPLNAALDALAVAKFLSSVLPKRLQNRQDKVFNKTHANRWFAMEDGPATVDAKANRWILASQKQIQSIIDLCAYVNVELRKIVHSGQTPHLAILDFALRKDGRGEILLCWIAAFGRLHSTPLDSQLEYYYRTKQTVNPNAPREFDGRERAAWNSFRLRILEVRFLAQLSTVFPSIAQFSGKKDEACPPWMKWCSIFDPEESPPSPSRRAQIYGWLAYQKPEQLDNRLIGHFCESLLAASLFTRAQIMLTTMAARSHFGIEGMQHKCFASGITWAARQVDLYVNQMGNAFNDFRTAGNKHQINKTLLLNYKIRRGQAGRASCENAVLGVVFQWMFHYLTQMNNEHHTSAENVFRGALAQTKRLASRLVEFASKAVAYVEAKNLKFDETTKEFLRRGDLAGIENRLRASGQSKQLPAFALATSCWWTLQKFGCEQLWLDDLLELMCDITP